MSYRTTRILILSLASLLLASCAAMKSGEDLSQYQRSELDEAYAAANNLLDRGRYIEASDEFADIADSLPSPYKDEALIRAAEYLILGDLVLNSFQYLRQVDESELTDSMLLEKRVLDAQYYRYTGRMEEALRHLDSELIEDADVEAQIKALEVLARIQVEMNDDLSSVDTRIKRGEILQGDVEESRQNTEALWRSLMRSDIAGVEARLSDFGVDSEFRAWLELAKIATPDGQSIDSLEQAYLDWKDSNPFIFLPEGLDESLRARWEYLDFKPQKIALLLPLTGDLAKPGKIIRTAFLAEHKQSQNTSTRIVSYNTNQQKPISAIYKQAVEEGADVVVGPLLKDNVERLMESVEFTVPTIALNYHSNRMFSPQGELFQFGLAPEDEAIQIADKMLKKGYRFAMIMAPDNAWGRRLENQFASEYLRQGGVVKDRVYYAPGTPNFSSFVQQSLHIDRSQARHTAIENVLREKAKFTPRIRDDVTAAVIFSKYKEAVLIYPMVKFYYGNELPMFATSHIYNPAQKKLLRELDGIVYSDIPAVLEAKPFTKKGEFPRLPALGRDAYQLSSIIRRVALGNTRLKGLTGTIELRNKAQLYRKLGWARFRRGRPVALGQGW